MQSDACFWTELFQKWSKSEKKVNNPPTINIEDMLFPEIPIQH